MKTSIDAAEPHTKKPTSTPAQVLTPQQLADYLQVPVETLRTWRKKGTGPSAYKVGKHLRYDIGHVQEYLDESLRRPGYGNTQSASLVGRP